MSTASSLIANLRSIPVIGYKKTICVFFVPFVLAVATVLAALPNKSQGGSSPTGQQKTDEKLMPVAEFAAPQPTDPQERALRQARSNRYNKPGGKPITELPPGVEELPLNAHWWWGLPALPASMSNTILVGEVISAEAYLSSDKTGVYSEFTVCINEVLKNDTGTPLVSDSKIVAERSGGAVRFPSGRIQHYSIAKQGIPLIGRRYVFFLKYNGSGQDFFILTGYELRNGQVFPLDGYDNKGKSVVSSFTAF